MTVVGKEIYRLTHDTPGGLEFDYTSFVNRAGLSLFPYTGPGSPFAMSIDADQAGTIGVYGERVFDPSYYFKSSSIGAALGFTGEIMTAVSKEAVILVVYNANNDEMIKVLIRKTTAIRWDVVAIFRDDAGVLHETPGIEFDPLAITAVNAQMILPDPPAPGYAILIVFDVSVPSPVIETITPFDTGTEPGPTYARVGIIPPVPLPAIGLGVFFVDEIAFFSFSVLAPPTPGTGVTGSGVMNHALFSEEINKERIRHGHIHR